MQFLDLFGPGAGAGAGGMQFFGGPVVAAGGAAGGAAGAGANPFAQMLNGVMNGAMGQAGMGMGAMGMGAAGGGHDQAWNQPVAGGGGGHAAAALFGGAHQMHHSGSPAPAPLELVQALQRGARSYWLPQLLAYARTSTPTLQAADVAEQAGLWLSRLLLLNKQQPALMIGTRAVQTWGDLYAAPSLPFAISALANRNAAPPGRFLSARMKEKERAPQVLLPSTEDEDADDQTLLNLSVAPAASTAAAPAASASVSSGSAAAAASAESARPSCPHCPVSTRAGGHGPMDPNLHLPFHVLMSAPRFACWILSPAHAHVISRIQIEESPGIGGGGGGGRGLEAVPQHPKEREREARLLATAKAAVDQARERYEKKGSGDSSDDLKQKLKRAESTVAVVKAAISGQLLRVQPGSRVIIDCYRMCHYNTHARVASSPLAAAADSNGDAFVPEDPVSDDEDAETPYGGNRRKAREEDGCRARCCRPRIIIDIVDSPALSTTPPSGSSSSSSSMWSLMGPTPTSTPMPQLESIKKSNTPSPSPAPPAAAASTSAAATSAPAASAPAASLSPPSAGDEQPDAPPIPSAYSVVSSLCRGLILPVVGRAEVLFSEGIPIAPLPLLYALARAGAAGPARTAEHTMAQLAYCHTHRPGESRSADISQRDVDEPLSPVAAAKVLEDAISGKKGASGDAENACASCGMVGAELRCVTCHTVYCDRTCQKEHWGIHRPVCRKKAAAANAREPLTASTFSPATLRALVALRLSELQRAHECGPVAGSFLPSPPVRDRVFPHGSLHEWIAQAEEDQTSAPSKPAFEAAIDAQGCVDPRRWGAMSHWKRMQLVREEACVVALERYLLLGRIPRITQRAMQFIYSRALRTAIATTFRGVVREFAVQEWTSLWRLRPSHARAMHSILQRAQKENLIPPRRLHPSGPGENASVDEHRWSMYQLRARLLQQQQQQQQASIASAGGAEAMEDVQAATTTAMSAAVHEEQLDAHALHHPVAASSSALVLAPHVDAFSRALDVLSSSPCSRSPSAMALGPSSAVPSASAAVLLSIASFLPQTEMLAFLSLPSKKKIHARMAQHMEAVCHAFAMREWGAAPLNHALITEVLLVHAATQAGVNGAVVAPTPSAATASLGNAIATAIGIAPMQIDGDEDDEKQSSAASAAAAAAPAKPSIASFFQQRISPATEEPVATRARISLTPPTRAAQPPSPELSPPEVALSSSADAASAASSSAAAASAAPSSSGVVSTVTFPSWLRCIKYRHAHRNAVWGTVGAAAKSGSASASSATSTSSTSSASAALSAVSASLAAASAALAGSAPSAGAAPAAGNISAGASAVEQLYKMFRRCRPALVESQLLELDLLLQSVFCWRQYSTRAPPSSSSYSSSAASTLLDPLTNRPRTHKFLFPLVGLHSRIEGAGPIKLSAGGEVKEIKGQNELARAIAAATAAAAAAKAKGKKGGSGEKKEQETKEREEKDDAGASASSAASAMDISAAADVTEAELVALHAQIASSTPGQVSQAEIAAMKSKLHSIDAQLAAAKEAINAADPSLPPAAVPAAAGGGRKFLLRDNVSLGPHPLLSLVLLHEKISVPPPPAAAVNMWMPPLASSSTKLVPEGCSIESGPAEKLLGLLGVNKLLQPHCVQFLLLLQPLLSQSSKLIASHLTSTDPAVQRLISDPPAVFRAAFTVEESATVWLGHRTGGPMENQLDFLAQVRMQASEEDGEDDEDEESEGGSSSAAQLHRKRAMHGGRKRLPPPERFGSFMSPEASPCNGRCAHQHNHAAAVAGSGTSGAGVGTQGPVADEAAVAAAAAAEHDPSKCTHAPEQPSAVKKASVVDSASPSSSTAIVPPTAPVSSALTASSQAVESSLVSPSVSQEDLLDVSHPEGVLELLTSDLHHLSAEDTNKYFSALQETFSRSNIHKLIVRTSFMTASSLARLLRVIATSSRARKSLRGLFFLLPHTALSLEHQPSLALLQREKCWTAWVREEQNKENCLMELRTSMEYAEDSALALEHLQPVMDHIVAHLPPDHPARIKAEEEGTLVPEVAPTGAAGVGLTHEESAKMAAAAVAARKASQSGTSPMLGPSSSSAAAGSGASKEAGAAASSSKSFATSASSSSSSASSSQPFTSLDGLFTGTATQAYTSMSRRMRELKRDIVVSKKQVKRTQHRIAQAEKAQRALANPAAAAAAAAASAAAQGSGAAAGGVGAAAVAAAAAAAQPPNDGADADMPDLIPADDDAAGAHAHNDDAADAAAHGDDEDAEFDGEIDGGGGMMFGPMMGGGVGGQMPAGLMQMLQQVPLVGGGGGGVGGGGLHMQNLPLGNGMQGLVLDLPVHVGPGGQVAVDPAMQAQMQQALAAMMGGVAGGAQGYFVAQGPGGTFNMPFGGAMMQMNEFAPAPPAAAQPAPAPAAASTAAPAAASSAAAAPSASATAASSSSAAASSSKASGSASSSSTAAAAASTKRATRTSSRTTSSAAARSSSAGAAAKGSAAGPSASSAAPAAPAVASGSASASAPPASLSASASAGSDEQPDSGRTPASHPYSGPLMSDDDETNLTPAPSSSPPQDYSEEDEHTPGPWGEDEEGEEDDEDGEGYDDEEEHEDDEADGFYDSEGNLLEDEEHSSHGGSSGESDISAAGYPPVHFHHHHDIVDASSSSPAAAGAAGAASSSSAAPDPKHDRTAFVPSSAGDLAELTEAFSLLLSSCPRLRAMRALNQPADAHALWAPNDAIEQPDAGDGPLPPPSHALFTRGKTHPREPVFTFPHPRALRSSALVDCMLLCSSGTLSNLENFEGLPVRALVRNETSTLRSFSRGLSAPAWKVLMFLLRSNTSVRTLDLSSFSGGYAIKYLARNASAEEATVHPIIVELSRRFVGRSEPIGSGTCMGRGKKKRGMQQDLDETESVATPRAASSSSSTAAAGSGAAVAPSALSAASAADLQPIWPRSITTMFFASSVHSPTRGALFHASGASPHEQQTFGTLLARSQVNDLAQMLRENKGLEQVFIDDLLHNEQVLQLDSMLADRPLHARTISAVSFDSAELSGRVRTPVLRVDTPHGDRLQRVVEWSARHPALVSAQLQADAHLEHLFDICAHWVTLLSQLTPLRGHLLPAQAIVPPSPLPYLLWQPNVVENLRPWSLAHPLTARLLQRLQQPYRQALDSTLTHDVTDSGRRAQWPTALIDLVIEYM